MEPPEESTQVGPVYPVKRQEWNLLLRMKSGEAKV
jgi:hypothetical protein